MIRLTLSDSFTIMISKEYRVILEDLNCFHASVSTELWSTLHNNTLLAFFFVLQHGIAVLTRQYLQIHFIEIADCRGSKRPFNLTGVEASVEQCIEGQSKHTHQDQTALTWEAEGRGMI